MSWANFSVIQVDNTLNVLEITLHHNYSKSDEITAFNMDTEADKTKPRTMRNVANVGDFILYPSHLLTKMRSASK